MKCKYSAKCGGCAYMGMTYEEQLQTKQKLVDKLIRPFGKVETIIGMEQPYNYRNKVHAVVSGDRHGNVHTGTYESGTHKIVPIDSCCLDNSKADAIVCTIRELMKSFKYKPYNEDTHRGFLRHILIRTAHATGEILVTLVVGDLVFPSKNNFVKALLKEHPEITSIVVNLNNRNTSMILGEREQTIYGKGYIEDVLCGKCFKISSKSFYQVNSLQTEILYGKAIEYANLKGTERIMDAYSGIGTIGIIASDYVKEVVGVESNRDAVADAGINLKLNGCRNVKYILKDAGEFMHNEAAVKSRYDVVFMDPPRAGSDAKFINAVVKLAPEKVVYISCNPDTLARDLALFKKKGYKMVKCTPVDMFPWTGSVEAVTLLVRN